MLELNKTCWVRYPDNLWVRAKYIGQAMSAWGEFLYWFKNQHSNSIHCECPSDTRNEDQLDRYSNTDYYQHPSWADPLPESDFVNKMCSIN